MDPTRHYMTHGASFIFTFEVCHARESHVILVFYGRRGTSYCLRIIAISATPFAVCHKVIKIAPNRLSDKDNLSKNQCHCLHPPINREMRKNAVSYGIFNEIKAVKLDFTKKELVSQMIGQPFYQIMPECFQKTLKKIKISVALNR